MRLLRYPFYPAEEIELTMPQGAQVVSVISQAGALGMWALADPAAPPERRKFRTVSSERSMTDLPDNLRFIGSFQKINGEQVFHFFEIIESHSLGASGSERPERGKGVSS